MEFIGRPTLPVPPTPLVGRELELERVSALLERDEVRLVTLTGMGGVGKTHLALAVARALEGRFLDGAVFVPLSAVREAALVPAALARALGLEEVATAPLEAVRSALRDREMLVVLDNLEQIPDAAWLVIELLELAPSIKVVVTSRSPLRLRGEIECPIAGLEVNAAVRLFEARAQATQPEFSLSEAQLDAVSAIARRVGGIPLALELAAARVRVLSVQGILERLDHPLALLSSGARDLPERQRGLRATLDWSFDLLEANDQEVLTRLGVFVTGFDLEALEAITGRDLDALEGLTRLIEHGLVVRLAPDRFTLLEPVREYALEQLAPATLERTRDAHAAHFLEVSDRARNGLISHDQVVWLDRLEREHANILAAIQHGLETGHAEFVARFAWNLWWFWLIRVNFEARRSIQEALEPRHGLRGANRARALWSLVALEFRSGGIEASHAQEALELFQQANDRQGEAFALFAVALAQLVAGHLPEALPNFERALALARACGEHWLTANTLQLLGWLAVLGGDLERARLAGEEACDIATRIGDSSLLAWNRLGSAPPPLQAGRIEEAVAHISEALRLARTVRDAAITAGCLEAFAAVAARVGDDERAARLWGVADHFRGARAAAPSLERGMFEPFVQAARAGLGTARFETERRRGETMSLESALEDALGIGSRAVRDPITDLTKRELEVLRLLAQGWPDKRIALELHVGLETVKTHVRSILSKFGVPNRAAATRHALEHGLT